MKDEGEMKMRRGRSLSLSRGLRRPCKIEDEEKTMRGAHDEERMKDRRAKRMKGR